MDVSSNHSREESHCSTSAADNGISLFHQAWSDFQDLAYQSEGFDPFSMLVTPDYAHPGPNPPAIYGAAHPEATTPTAGPSTLTSYSEHIVAEAQEALEAAEPCKRALDSILFHRGTITEPHLLQVQYVLGLLITALRSTRAEVTVARATVAEREGRLRQQEDANAALNSEHPSRDGRIVQYAAENEGLRGEVRQLQFEHRGSQEEVRRLRQERDRMREEIERLRQSQQRFVLAATQVIHLSDPQDSDASTETI